MSTDPVAVEATNDIPALPRMKQNSFHPHNHEPEKNIDSEGKEIYRCRVCHLPMEKVELGEVKYPEPLKHTWWSKSLWRALLRRALGITQDVAQGEALAMSLLQSNAGLAAVVQKQGNALNGVGNELIALRRKVQFYERADALQRVVGAYRKILEEEAKQQAAQEPVADPKIVRPNLIVTPGRMPPADETLNFQKDGD